MKVTGQFKRIISLVLLIAPLLLISYSLLRHYQLNNQIQTQRLPSFEYQTLIGGERVNNQTVNYEQGLWVAKVNTSCSSCWDQISVFCQLSKKMEAAGLQLIIIVEGDPVARSRLLQQLKDEQCLQGAYIVSDPLNSFESDFSAYGIPALYCYDQKGVLKQTFVGATHPNLLLPLITTHK